MDVKRIVSLGIAAIFWVGLLGVAGPAFAQASKRYKEQIKEYSKQLDQLDEQDEWGAAAEDRKRARQWLADAKELLAQGDTDTASWLVKQVGESLDLISALVTAKKIEAMADEQEETYHKLKENKVSDLESKIADLKEQKKKLEAELRELQ